MRGGKTKGVEAIRALLEFIGEDPDRGGLQETSERVAKAWLEWTSGYSTTDEEIGKLLKVFEDGAEAYDEMILIKKIPFYSHCEHHLAPIFGTCTIGYIPTGKIVGLSKPARLVDVFAKRLQVQERMTNQIASAMEKHLAPKGVGVLIDARHFCIESRGVEKPCIDTVTSAMRGVMKTSPAARAEFLHLSNGK